jgi:hypothetical protein
MLKQEIQILIRVFCRRIKFPFFEGMAAEARQGSKIILE